jgi:hypothetical protein
MHPSAEQSLIIYLRENSANNRNSINVLRQTNKLFNESLDNDFMFMQKYINKKTSININDWFYVKTRINIEQNENLWKKSDFALYNAFRLYAMYRRKNNLYRTALNSMISDIASGLGAPRWMFNRTKQYYKDRQTQAILDYTYMVNNGATLEQFYKWIMKYISKRSLTSLGI